MNPEINKVDEPNVVTSNDTVPNSAVTNNMVPNNINVVLNSVITNNEPLNKSVPQTIVPHENIIIPSSISSTLISNTPIQKASVQKKSNGSILILIVILLIILLVGATAFAYIKKAGPFSDIQNNQVNNIEATSSVNNNPVVNNGAEISTTTVAGVQASSSPSSTSSNDIKSSTTTLSQAGLVDLWSVFDKAFLALKNKDVASYNKYSYIKVAPDQESQFLQFVPFLIGIDSKVNKNDYVNKWQDDKQAIFSTDPQKTDNDTQYGYKRGMIMFINKDGSWKVLSVSPEREWAVSKKGTNHTVVQIEQELQAMMIDSDRDGLTDEEESCLGAKKGDPTCVKTDPNKRDTNGDGWWDGVRSAMKE